MIVFRTKQCLVISPEPWGDILLSKHHFARALADAGNKVVFLEPAWPHIPERRGEEFYPNIRVFTDSYHPRGMRFLPATLQRMAMRRAAVTLENSVGTPFDLVWSFDNSRWFHLDVFSKSCRIHHVADLEMDYHLETASRSAHLCLGVSQTIVSRLKPFNTHAHFVQHGYLPLAATGKKIPGRVGHLKALYCGNLLMKFFDLALFDELSQNFQEVDFVLVGSTGRDNLNNTMDQGRTHLLQSMSARANVFLTGELPAADAQTLMGQADVLLLAYFNYPREVDNSSKILPYLASGKPIIANFTREFADTGLLEMVSTRPEYQLLFERVTTHISEYNRAEQTNKRREFALSNTYAAHLERIENWLNEAL